MNLFRFILGVLGVVLIIGAFSLFFPLVFLGGLATGSFSFALGFPIFLMILGAGMVYFGFYYKEGSPSKNNYNLIFIAKWGAIFTIAILISNYVLDKLMILNTFLVVVFSALLISMVVQIVRSHEESSTFRMKWFFFYFLVFANLLWAMGEYVLPKIAFQAGFFSSLILGFSLAGIFIILQKSKIRSSSLSWASTILILVLLVSNLGSLQDLGALQGITFSKLGAISQNTSTLSEEKQTCPTTSPYLTFYEKDINIKTVTPYINGLLNTSVWRIENSLRSCYKGKYKGQYPSHFYCDDMVVSRWDTSSSGTINYRWYTAITAEWLPVTGASGIVKYEFVGFSCENGQKVTVDKETTSYYVYVARDGTEIRVKY